VTLRKLAVVVLAAGEGTRMKSKIPKVMHGIAGLPLIGHVLATAHSFDSDAVVIVLRHQKQQIETYVSSSYPGTLIATQDDIPGTGRAAQLAIAELPSDFDGDVLVLSGDVPLLDVNSIADLIAIHREFANAGTLLSTVLENPHGYGRIMRSQEDFLGIIEQKDASELQLEIKEINAGVYIFDAVVLRKHLESLTINNSQSEKYLTDVAGLMLEAGEKVAAHLIQDKWLVTGVNDRAQLQELAAELNSRIIKGWQLAGVSIQEPGSTWIDVTVQLGTDVTLLPGTRLHGLTSIGEGSQIGPDTTLTDSRIGAGVIISRSQVEESIIAAGATVGPFSYLRAGTELGSDGKIGAFVETKNAQIGAGTKVPHLSYVGDAEIGEGSNIGAGTIFANYDGVTKHRIKIGNQVRTGSGNVFVAPISIGDGAYTAAGSTIRRSVESGALALNPTPQKNIAGWVLDKRPGSKAALAASKDTE
jgi:bifunctional UDP-N-acetylglucosamine pyrophosphorylase/glucosamine-1-phosphate N-acetyltransferase